MATPLTPEQTQHYRLKGIESKHAGKDPCTGFTEAFGKPDDDNRPAWMAFYDGANEARIEIEAAKRVAYRVDEFLDKLRVLCAEYDASISSGCGCCGAGLTVKGDYETGIEVGGDDWP